MKIFLHEITDIETELDFTQEDAWVSESIESVDEKSLDEPRFQPPQPQHPSQQLSAISSKRTTSRPAQVHFNLRQVDEVVVVSGKISTHIQLLCSRCANSFSLPCSQQFSSLFCKDPDMAGIAHLDSTGSKGAPLKPVGQNKGFARHAHDFGHDEQVEEGKDLDITYISGNYIDLAEILAEQLQLRVPFQPLCRVDCNGICANCGTDLNQGRCACSKINKTSPFAGLQTFKDLNSI